MSRIVHGCIGAVIGGAVAATLAWMIRELPPSDGSHPRGAAEWLFILTLAAVEGYSIGAWRGAMQIMLVQAGMVSSNEWRVPEYLKPSGAAKSAVRGLPRFLTALLAAVEGTTLGLVLGWLTTLFDPALITLAIYPRVSFAICLALLWVSGALWGMRNMARTVAAMDAAEDGVPFEEMQEIPPTPSSQPLIPTKDGPPASKL